MQGECQEVIVKEYGQPQAVNSAKVVEKAGLWKVRMRLIIN